jgi:parvulin-like peptidyl-prolyl isomerase
MKGISMKKLVIGSIASAILSVSLSATVYAIVDGEEVTDQDIKVFLRAVPGSSFEQLQPQTQQSILNQAIERKLLSKEAMKSGISKTFEFKKALSAFKKDLALELWMKKIFQDIKVSKKEIKKYFNDNSDKFVKPPRVKASHILLKTEDDAQKVIDKLKGLKGDALMKKFKELAIAKSIGPSGKQGGSLGWFGKNQMVKPFSEASFALKKGEFTKKPVKTQFGFHVILVEDKEDGKKMTLKEVEDQIKNNIKLDKFKKDVASKAKKLRKNAKVEIKIGESKK